MTIAFVYALVAALAIPAVFSMLKVPYTFVDIAIVSIGHAPFSLVLTIGGPLSLLALIALLKWRVGSASMFDLGVAVGASRLLAIPALMALRELAQNAP